MNLAEYRRMQRELVRIELDLGDLADELKTHPRRPGPHETPSKEWLAFSRRLFRERGELKKDRRELVEKIAAAKAQLLDTPLSMVSLAELIDGLVLIETTLDERGPDDAHRKLSGFIDWLEGEEARLQQLAAAGKKAS